MAARRLAALAGTSISRHEMHGSELNAVAPGGPHDFDVDDTNAVVKARKHGA